MSIEGIPPGWKPPGSRQVKAGVTSQSLGPLSGVFETYASARFKPAVVVSNSARVGKHAVLCAGCDSVTTQEFSQRWG